MLFFILLMLASKETKEEKKVSIQMEKLRCNTPPPPFFMLCHRAILYIVRTLGE